MFKRVLDCVLSALLLAAASPLLACAAIAIKLDSEGPAIFRQDRMGRGFRRFQLLKLRTMHVDCRGSAYTLGEDPRITRVGRWLRRLKIDELPQLWNVLRGDMSLVGPRPVIPELTMEFRRDYERLLHARPGITDPASLRYWDETQILAQVPDPMRYFKTVLTPEKLRISWAYQKRATVWTDLQVLAQTAIGLVAVLMPTFDFGQSTAPGFSGLIFGQFSRSEIGSNFGSNSPVVDYRAVPVELLAAGSERNVRYGRSILTKFAYRSFRHDSNADEWNRQRIVL